MKNMFKNTVQVRISFIKSATQDFKDVRGISHTNYCDVLNKAFEGEQLTADKLKFDFGTHKAEIESISEDYLTAEGKTALWSIIMDCYSPVCSIYVIARHAVRKETPTLMNLMMQEGDILVVHEDGRSVFIHN